MHRKLLLISIVVFLIATMQPAQRKPFRLLQQSRIHRGGESVNKAMRWHAVSTLEP
jgi:hypothetical protein